MICKFAEPFQSLQQVTIAGPQRLHGRDEDDELVMNESRDSFFNDCENEMDGTLGMVHNADIFEVSLDVTGFQPEDLTVILHEDQVTISGLHQEKSLDGTEQMERAFKGKYTLPHNIDRAEVTSNVTADGRLLKIVGPLVPQEAPVTIQEEKVTVETITTRRG